MPDKTLLLVEDEPDLVDLLSFSLEQASYRVESALTGEDGLQAARRLHPDLILLDLMLPGMDGLEVCRNLRHTPELRDTPVIMLTARNAEQDIVRGLEIGADDYIAKPFSTPVLLARIKAVLRRAADGAEPKRVIEAGGVRLDADRHEVQADGETVSLTATEFKLLTLLVARPGRVFTRQQIIDTLHEGFAAVTDRSVDVQVVGLRRKLGASGARIETVRGVGYRFRA